MPPRPVKVVAHLPCVQPSTNIVLFKYTTFLPRTQHDHLLLPSWPTCTFAFTTCAVLLQQGHLLPGLPPNLHMRPLWSPPTLVTLPSPARQPPTEKKIRSRPSIGIYASCPPYLYTTTATGEILSRDHREDTNDHEHCAASTLASTYLLPHLTTCSSTCHLAALLPRYLATSILLTYCTYTDQRLNFCLSDGVTQTYKAATIFPSFRTCNRTSPPSSTSSLAISRLSSAQDQTTQRVHSCSFV